MAELSGALEHYSENNNGQLPGQWSEFWAFVLGEYETDIEKEQMQDHIERELGGDPELRVQLLTNNGVRDANRGQLIAVSAIRLNDDGFDVPIRHLIWLKDEDMRASYLREPELQSVLDRFAVQLATNGVEGVKVKHIEEMFGNQDRFNPFLWIIPGLLLVGILADLFRTFKRKSSS